MLPQALKHLLSKYEVEPLYVLGYKLGLNVTIVPQLEAIHSFYFLTPLTNHQETLSTKNLPLPKSLNSLKCFLCYRVLVELRRYPLQLFVFLVFHKVFEVVHEDASLHLEQSPLEYFLIMLLCLYFPHPDSHHPSF